MLLFHCFVSVLFAFVFVSVLFFVSCKRNKMLTFLAPTVHKYVPLPHPRRALRVYLNMYMYVNVNIYLVEDIKGDGIDHVFNDDSEDRVWATKG